MIMNDSKSLTEIWSTREKLYEETKNLTGEQRKEKLHKETSEIIAQIKKKQKENLIGK
jgi:shikimate kinase